MAFIKIKNVVIRGISACVPKRKIENDDSLLFTKEELQRFYGNVGIYRRRCVVDGMTTSDLFFEAAELFIKDLNWDKSEVEALIN